MIYFFTCLNILNYLDRYLVAAVLPYIESHFSLSHEQAGHVQSAFVVGYVLFAPIFGMLGDKMSRTKLMAFGAVAWSLATVASGLVSSYIPFYILRVLVGIGEASFATAAPGFIKERYQNPAQVNGALALFFSAIPIGAALAYVVGGIVAEAYGWRAVFLLAGSPGLFLSLLIAKVRDNQSKSNSSISLRIESIKGIVVGIREIVSCQPIVFAILGYTFNSFALNGIATFIVPYGSSIGFSEASIGKYFGLILIITGFLGTLAGGRVASFFIKKSIYPLRAIFLLIGFLSVFAAPVLVLAFLGLGKTPFLISCFITELLIFATMAPVNSILVIAAPEGFVTFTQGITILCLNLCGAFLAPIIIGRVADGYGLAVGLQLSSFALGCCGLIWLYGGLLLKRNSSEHSK